MPTITRTISDSLVIADVASVILSGIYSCYGSVDGGDRFFANELGGQRWLAADRRRKIQSLVSATKYIDRLNFAGSKASADQQLQFPRGTDTLVPVDIEQACYHLAQALLKGVDPDTERDNLSSTLQGYAGLQTRFDRQFVPSYTRAGIPNASAWELLLPYLVERREIEIKRVS